MSKKEAKDKVVRGLEIAAEIIGLLILLIPFLSKKQQKRKKPWR